MASIYRRTYTRPIPAGAEIVTRGKGKDRHKAARFVSRRRVRTVRLTEDGRFLLLERKCWYVAYYDAAGERRTRKGFADREATEQLARDLERQAERKKAGLVSVDPEKLTVPFAAVVALYVADLQARGKDGMYVYNCQKRLEKLSRECDWPTPAAVRLDAFTRWRSEATKGSADEKPKSPRTVNQYADTLSAFLTWCVAQHYLAGNPLELVDRADESDRWRKRRALTLDELRKLLAVAPPARALVYLAAMKTGLRRDELRQLQWGDVRLDGSLPHIHFRGTANKSRREDDLPLDAELAEVLTSIRPPAARGNDRVFTLIPAMETYRKDLDAAAIEYKDDQGRQADFHALRMSYNMLLAKGGVPVRVAMALMRHTDIDLTTKAYTDPRLLDLHGEVGKLPRLTGPGRNSDAEVG